MDRVVFLTKDDTTRHRDGIAEKLDVDWFSHSAVPTRRGVQESTIDGDVALSFEGAHEGNKPGVGRIVTQERFLHANDRTRDVPIGRYGACRSTAPRSRTWTRWGRGLGVVAAPRRHEDAANDNKPGGDQELRQR